MLASLGRIAVTALCAAAGTQAIPQSQTASGGKACNNSPTLCNRQYNAITHLGAHNSAFLRDQSNGNSLAGNQFQNATAALDAGVRLLQVQIHKPNTTLELCHTSCSLLDAGALSAWLIDINSWMTSNPNDVVTLLLVNSDNAPASDFQTVFDSSGLAKLAYSPQSTSTTTSWPTLQSMIGQNTRVVTFVTNMNYSAAAPFLLPEFDHVFETPFDVTDVSGFNCTVDRPSRANPASSAISNGYMSLVNHFKYQNLIGDIEVPDVDMIGTVNSAATTTAGNLGKHLQDCKSEWNKQPTFFLVDFWDKGDPVAAMDGMNGVSDATGRTTVTGSDKSAGSRFASEGKMEYTALVAFVFAALMLV